MINESLIIAMNGSGSKTDRIGSAIAVDLPLFPPEDIASIGEVFSSGKVMVRRQKIILPDRKIFAETTILPIRKDDEVAKVIVVIRDRSNQPSKPLCLLD